MKSPSSAFSHLLDQISERLLAAGNMLSEFAGTLRDYYGTQTIGGTDFLTFIETLFRDADVITKECWDLGRQTFETAPSLGDYPFVFTIPMIDMKRRVRDLHITFWDARTRQIYWAWASVWTGWTLYAEVKKGNTFRGERLKVVKSLGEKCFALAEKIDKNLYNPLMDLLHQLERAKV